MILSERTGFISHSRASVWPKSTFCICALHMCSAKSPLIPGQVPLQVRVNQTESTKFQFQLK
ncbi:hypothetical protein JZ751_025692 [Albula glossodonta]|uniref:Uncharacterized protein n=1 Tax=Albula glossodonta TaxID=121402 RepID=A0A8T2NLJ3_9TELE|nr:hypothetical protein JZ751_025692 [Albula glossodonta]